MITVDFERLGVGPGTLLLDLGSGNGRHTFEALKRGAECVSVDLDSAYLPVVKEMSAAMGTQGECGPDTLAACLQGDAEVLPFNDSTFDCVIAAEVLEHIPADHRAIAEIERVMKPGARVAVTVPRAWPERICWAISKEYAAEAGGHVRIYEKAELIERLSKSGLAFSGSHYAHAFHSPYWWLKCAVGVNRDDALPARAYKRFLEWQIVRQPPLVDRLERVLDPFLGKSLVVYAQKPLAAEARRVA